MEIDTSEEENARNSDELRKLATKGPLSTSIAKLSGSSRVLPSQKDYHFYYNFQEFRNPVQDIDRKSQNLLNDIGSSEHLFGKAIPFPDENDVALDEDVALDWLVNANDEIFERFDVSLDEFKRERKQEEETGVRTMRVNGDGDEENGFQMVYGKKNKKLALGQERNVEGIAKGIQDVKVAEKVKPKVPFHISTIPRPQDEHRIIVNNSNQPFEHVWLERSADGSSFFHPLEKCSVLDFVDSIDFTIEPVKPLPLEVTPFKYVDDVKELKQLAVKLREVDEFAVDLEHNQYRSFQGITCLMQISTRTEDFVIDTLKLRVQIGPHLREVFKDPSKRKVLHGADRDIVWLQRDFGIYVCNMFDTGQASRVLKMERFSLEHLLLHFCGVVANKEYQNADWRIRPLPSEMMKYAREDTHYLLYIFDRMIERLLNSSADSECSDPPIVEVYKRSYDICTQLYEKELLTDTSYLHIYGMQEADFNAQQLAVVSGLYGWRDGVARTEDESTGYVLPNRTLIEIAKQMPLTPGQLRRVLKSKHPFIERNLASILSVIRHSIQNATAFEETAKHIKERRLEILNNVVVEESEALPSEKSLVSVQQEDMDMTETHISPTEKINGKEANVAPPPLSGEPENARVAEASVQILKKPSRAFGALLGNSTKRKFDPERREKEGMKLEQIKSTVSLPFHTFSGRDDQLKPGTEEAVKTSEVPQRDVPVPAPATGSTLDDVIILEDDSDVEGSTRDNSKATNDDQPKQQLESTEVYLSDSEEDEPMSLSDLSSNFDKCFPSLAQTTTSKVVDKSELSSEVKPFDYENARKQIKFGDVTIGESNDSDRRNRSKGSAIAAKSQKGEETTDLPQGKRRHAFPASGNRNATFR